jgi:hypothetical protein
MHVLPRKDSRPAHAGTLWQVRSYSGGHQLSIRLQPDPASYERSPHNHTRACRGTVMRP